MTRAEVWASRMVAIEERKAENTSMIASSIARLVDLVADSHRYGSNGAVTKKKKSEKTKKK